MNLIANTELTLMLFFFFLIIILRTDMRIGLILISLLQCDRSGHLSRGCLFVPQEIFVRISISTGGFEEIQLPQHSGSLFTKTLPFMEVAYPRTSAS
jgi:hypothetical protein